jgi:DNA anti-recombination protein RmuC
MKNEDRIVELLAELVQKQDVFAGKLEKVSDKLEKVSGKLDDVVGEVRSLREDMDQHYAKNNAGIQEVRLSVVRLADKLDKQDELEKRIVVLEKIVLK